VVHIETVDLSPRGIVLPNDRVGMVIAQPYVPRALLTAAEPYCCIETAKPQQLAVLNETLAVARSLRHGAPKTHFTIFPEYTIPGLDGIAAIETALHAPEWPNSTVVIGGTDALSQAQYTQLLQGAATHVDAARNGGNLVQVGQWVNCAITWVKNADGSLDRWIQPKLHPAWEEMNIRHEQMFRGSSIYLFKGVLENGAPYRFATLVCFDWIATVGTQTALQWILGDLQQQAAGNQLPLSWLFVIQRNPKPSHDTFLNGVSTFFNQTQFPNALRERACLIFANTAGRPTPGRSQEYGACSLVFSPQSLFQNPNCVPTFCRGGRRFRDGSTLLMNYKDVFFRERGACIHSFAQVNPGSLIAGPSGRSFAVENAHVCPISGTLEPRAPSAAVPAAVKWLNDELDDVPSLSATYKTAALNVQVDGSHQQNISSLRQISSQSATNSIKLAVQESPVGDADEWDATESQALRHVVHTLDIVALGFPSPVVGADPAHAMVQIDNKAVDLLAIRGTSHEGCIEHSKLFLTSPQRQVLLISRDPDNTRWQQRFRSFLQPTTPQVGQERNITDPTSGSLHLGYQNLLEIFRNSTVPTAVTGGINAELNA
jgi:hypothetical protein